MTFPNFVCSSPIIISSPLSTRKDSPVRTFGTCRSRVRATKRARCCSSPPVEGHSPALGEAEVPEFVRARAVFSNGHDVEVSRSSGNTGPNALDLLQNFTLPAGFPATVGSGYIPFSICNVVRQMFRNAYYVLGTSSLLVALSADSASQLTLSAALTWALKDGLGLAAQACLSSTLGPMTDADPKRARMSGEFLMVASGAAEVCSVLAPSAFLFFASLAGVLRKSGDALSGPGYRVFLDRLAIAGNIGDVSARGEAQVVFGKLLGLGLGAAVVAALAATPQDPNVRLSATGIAFGLLAVGHLATSRVQVSTVCLATLNSQRLNLILDAFLSTGRVPSIAHVNSIERVVYLGSPPHSCARSIVYGVDLQSVKSDDTFLVPRSVRYFLVKSGDGVAVAFRKDASTKDVLLSTLEARRLLQSTDRWQAETMESAQRWALATFNDFETQLKTEGWDTSRFLSPIGKMKYSTNL